MKEIIISRRTKRNITAIFIVVSSIMFLYYGAGIVYWVVHNAYHPDSCRTFIEEEIPDIGESPVGLSKEKCFRKLNDLWPVAILYDQLWIYGELKYYCMMAFFTFSAIIITIIISNIEIIDTT